MFIAEGKKSMFRLTYAILKVHKDFIKTIESKDKFIAALGEHSKKNTNTLALLDYAFKYKMGAAK